jgi:hypothetical protein
MVGAVPEIVQLHDPKKLASALAEESVRVIHLTPSLDAIKRLVVIADMLKLSVDLHLRFTGTADLVWDPDAIQELSCQRRALYVFHRTEFAPQRPFIDYDGRLVNLVRLVALKFPRLYNSL